MKQIVHKKLLKCKTINPPPGLGDFLRGTVALYQLSKKLNFELLVDFSEHPAAKFLNSNFSSNLETYEYFNQEGLADFLVENDVVSIETNCVYEREPDEDCIEFIKQNFQPNQILLEKINNKLPLNDFNVLHIRSGDNLDKLNDEWLGGQNRFIVPPMYQMRHIIDTIAKYLHLIGDSQVIVMADQKFVCDAISNSFNFKTLNSHPVHFGSLNSQDVEKDLGETLEDFFVMSKAKKILSFSVYSWQSGFSHMCSQIFRIPFYGFTL